MKTIYRYYAFNFFQSAALFSAVLVPFFTNWGHISLFQVQVLQAWFMFWIFVLEIPTGAIADHLGRKDSMAIGALITGIATLIYGSFPIFGIFLLGEFLFAIGVALMSGADEALLYDAVKESGQEDRAKEIFGKAQIFELLGILISAPIGSLIAAKLGLNFPMLLSFIPFFLAALIAVSIKEPLKPRREIKVRDYSTLVREALVFFKNHRSLKLLAVDAILVASVAYFVIWFYQPLLTRVGVPIIYFGFFHAFLVLSEMVVAGNFRFLEKVLGSAGRLVRGTALLTGITFLVVAVFPNIYTVIAFIALAGGFGLTRLTLLSSHMNAFIPSDKRATVLSAISTFRRLALVILNPVIGFMADKSLPVSLGILGAISLSVFFFSKVEREV